ncbi:C69 family dipeptidase [Sansalvadorimonas sp. 2012CJ34-2]|uniref:Dipeptidase n=1 Tax=Parendozoicomonas callyspongiae TaxID=2942213 RepID=A0ABT0PF09_9GAMM|nr:C69 family dipeptidase [Sansalvadorimonas sp. 2012CJ34-2]MCL6269591.1 C69 family dipeptidase [Sansalvadorimonas sp. 2012CJ34-2]
MSLMKKALVAAIAAAVAAPSAMACTSVMVGKNVSESGAIMLSRNEDFISNNWAKHMVIYPARTYKKGDTITLSNGLTVPAPAKALRYTAMIDWDNTSYDIPNNGKVFEERGVNELNVAMSATNSAEGNEKALKADPLIEDGIIEQNMVGLVLSEATSARNAVEILGRYIEKYGAGETNGIQFADQNEAWYMETGGGHQWIAVRIPDDKYLVIANGLRIHGVDLDSKDVMHVEGLFDMVKKNKLLDNPDRKSFNFAKAFGVPGDIYNTDREWLSQKMLTPSLKQESRQDQYPLFLSPDKKIGVDEVAAVLRADYNGTELENIAPRPSGVDRNAEAHIIEMYGNMPKELTAVIWQTPSAVNYSPFIPFYNVMEKVPAEYAMGTDSYDDQSAWWNFRALGALASKNVQEGKYRPVVEKVWNDLEHRFIASQPYMNSMLKDMYKKDSKLAVSFASDYSNGILQTSLNKATELKSALMTDLTRSTEKKYSPEEFEKISNL